MSKILSIDASTEACSVALLNGNEVIEDYRLAPRQHAALLLPMVEKLLVDASLSLNQLDAIACNVGPGAFTGIRIGVSVAQGLAYGADLPTIAVSGLYNLAQQAVDKSPGDIYLAAIDARMSEVYLGAFKHDQFGLAEAISEEAVLPPKAINFDAIKGYSASSILTLVGSGWSAYEREFLEMNIDFSSHIEDHFPRASACLKWADRQFKAENLLQAAMLQPSYLRNKVAEKKAKLA